MQKQSHPKLCKIVILGIRLYELQINSVIVKFLTVLSSEHGSAMFFPPCLSQSGPLNSSSEIPVPFYSWLSIAFYIGKLFSFFIVVVLSLSSGYY